MRIAATVVVPSALVAALSAAAPGISVVAAGVGRQAQRQPVSPTSGQDLYAEHCATCHGKKGEGSAMGRPLTGDKAYGDAKSDILAVIRDGIPDSPMVAFRETLSEDEIAAVTKFVVSLSKR